MKYSYSTNEENFYGQYETIEEAIKHGLDDNPDSDSIYIGSNCNHTAHEFISVSNILDDISEAAGDECGESAEDWLEIIHNDNLKKRELAKLIGDWIEANDPVTFYSVADVKRFER